MDPLILIIEELHRARSDVEKYETDLSEYEARTDFNNKNARYNRLLLEKDLVLRNLCDLRLELSKKATDLKGRAIYAREEDGATRYFLDKAPSNSDLATVALNVEPVPEVLRPYPNNSMDNNSMSTQHYNSNPSISSARRPHAHSVNVTAHAHAVSQQHTNLNITHNVSPYIQQQSPQQVQHIQQVQTHAGPGLSAHAVLANPTHGSYVISSPAGYSGPPTQRRPDPTDLPDLPRYLTAKADLSAIMRDFTDNKIHFVGTDNHVIAMAEYQNISKFTKSGEDPAKFMKGEYRSYKTGYVKKTNSYTENKLFFPVFHPYAPQHISGML